MVLGIYLLKLIEVLFLNEIYVWCLINAKTLLNEMDEVFRFLKPLIVDDNFIEKNESTFKKLCIYGEN